MKKRSFIRHIYLIIISIVNIVLVISILIIPKYYSNFRDNKFNQLDAQSTIETFIDDYLENCEKVYIKNGDYSEYLPCDKKYNNSYFSNNIEYTTIEDTQKVDCDSYFKLSFDNATMIFYSNKEILVTFEYNYLPFGLLMPMTIYKCGRKYFWSSTDNNLFNDFLSHYKVISDYYF